MKLGFTGSREGGFTWRQKYDFGRFLFVHGDEITEAHHGDCVGRDEAFHHLIRRFLPSVKIVVHPPDNDRLRAFCQGDETREPLPYRVRNHNIVNECAHLLAAPNTIAEQIQSGTWATVRYARHAGKPVTILAPRSA